MDEHQASAWKTMFSADFTGIYYAQRSKASTVLVTFDTLFDHRRPPNGTPPCTRTAARLGYSHVHVYCGRNIWYQTPDMAGAIEAARSITRNYANVVVYGSSMGGYGALLFSRRLGATRVVALAPQFSVDPKKMPDELRWRSEVEAIEFIDDDVLGEASSSAPLYIVHDPFCMEDKPQVRPILDLPTARPIKLPLSGHLPIQFLHQAGIRFETLATLFQEKDPAPSIWRARRAGRARSARYFFELADALACRGQIDAALRSIGRGYVLSPDPSTAAEGAVKVLIRSGKPRTYNVLVHMLFRLITFDHPEWTHYDSALANLWSEMESELHRSPSWQLRSRA